MNDPGFYKRQKWLMGTGNELKSGTGGFFMPIMPSITGQGGASVGPGTNPIQELMAMLSGGGGGGGGGQPPAGADPRIAAIQQVAGGGGSRPGAGPFPPELMQSRVPVPPPEQYPGGPSNVRVPQNYSEEADAPDPYQGNPTNRPMHPGDYDPGNPAVEQEQQSRGRTTEDDLQQVYDKIDYQAGDDVDTDQEEWPDTPEEFKTKYGREPATDAEMEFYYGPDNQDQNVDGE